MKTILLACSAGMSTSMLVQRMQKEAEKQNLDVDISATSSDQVDYTLGQKDVDVIMIGPQVRYLEKDFKERYEPEIPVTVINATDYGRMKGERVLKNALDIIDNKDN